MNDIYLQNDKIFAYLTNKYEQHYNRTCYNNDVIITANIRCHFIMT